MDDPDRAMNPAPIPAFRFLRSLAALAALLIIQNVSAHFCGPTRIELQVGQSCPWTITADRTEKLSLYVPVINGDPGVASAEPLTRFMAHHGEFTITGKSVGTNTLSVAWSYEPTGAFGFCDVTIVVKEADPENKPLDSPGAGGTLATSGLQMITNEDLKGFIDKHIPAECERLLIFTQCFGGNIAQAEGFRDMPNTAIASASSPNQTAKYGGYDDDAARGLRPEEGRTALDMHRDGVRGRNNPIPPRDGTPRSKKFLFKDGEWPVTAGGMNLDAFSLAPVSNDGPVKSRHIVFFAGQPEDKKLYLDTQDGYTVKGNGNPMDVEVGDPAVRDRVKSNFAGQQNTTVRTVGGEPIAENSTTGKDGWDLAGTYEGLEKAIKEAGDAIRNSPDPSAEQFILYVGDHGGQGFTVVDDPIELDANGTYTLQVDLSTLQGSDVWLEYAEIDTSNTPTIQVDTTSATGAEHQSNGIKAAGNSSPDISLGFELELLGGRIVELPAPESIAIDSNGDGVRDPATGDVTRHAVGLPESILVGPDATTVFTLRIRNKASTAIMIDTVQLNSGKISKNSDMIATPVFRQVERIGADVLRFSLRGAPGETYQLEGSDDFANWSTVEDVRFNTEYIEFETSFEATNPPRFFRLTWTAPPPFGL